MSNNSSYRYRRDDRRWRNEYRHGHDGSSKGYKARRLYEEAKNEPLDPYYEEEKPSGEEEEFISSSQDAGA